MIADKLSDKSLGRWWADRPQLLRAPNFLGDRECREGRGQRMKAYTNRGG